VHPALASADGHSLFREVVAHHCRVAGVLRIDHVMGLHRLFWVPDGAEAREGVYVRYPMDELLAVLSIESCRHDCYIVGEDLGTVPDEVREGMARHDLLSMYVAQFQTPASPGAVLMPPWQRCVASVDTHDTPTFAGWIAARDVDHRLEAGRCSYEEAQEVRSQRAIQVTNLRTFLTERGLLGSSGLVGDGRDDPTALHAALLRFLGDSDASVLLVALEDLWGETEPQNVPGTPVDRPNWVQMFPMDLDRLLADSAIEAVFHALQEARLGSYFRARHQLEGAP
jgi:4-alpha-glucanotransferase